MAHLTSTPPIAKTAKANSLKSRKSRRPQSASQQFNGSSSSGNGAAAAAAAANDAATDDDEEFEEDGNFEDGEALQQGSPVAPLTDANSGGSSGRTAPISGKSADTEETRRL